MSRYYPHALLAACFWASLSCSTTWAQALQPLRVEQVEGEYRIPLGWLNNQHHAPIELRGAESRHILKLPISPRLAIQEAKIEMVYTNSISLLPRSQLALTLNDRVLAQLPVKADQPDHAARITLPLDGLAPGYRELGFRAAQHYTNECEDPSSPELYSQIDTEKSVLRVKTTRRAFKPSLARLDDIFDRRLWLDRYTLHILLPPQAMQQEELRQAAAQLSQSIASVVDYLPVSIQLQELKPSMPQEDQASSARRFPGVNLPDTAWDAVLLGTRDQLLPFLSAKQAAQIKSGYLGIFHSDQDPTRYILLVSGTTAAEVRDAATLLNLPGLALPDREEIQLAELKLEHGYKRKQPPQVEKGWITFDQLGFHTTSMKGMYPPPARVEFWAFREMFDPARPFIELQLNFAYGAGFDKKSALNVLLNGQFIQALPMQEKHGDQVFRAKVRLPTVSLRPGMNELSFEASMIGEDVGGACEPIFTDNLRVTIFEDSRIELPPISDYMSLPDLGLLGKTALPYTRLADGHGVGLMLSDLSPATISSALTLLGKLRQVHKAPLISLRILSPTDDLTGLEGLIVIGPINALPESIRTGMTAFMPHQRWQTLMIGSKIETDMVTGVKRWVQDPLIPLVKLSEVTTPAVAEVNLSEGLGQSAALVQYVTDNGLPVTVLTAADHEHLVGGAARLVEHSTWGALGGSAMLWSMDGEAIAKAEPVTHSFIGEAPSVSPVSYLLSDRPGLAIAVAIGLITMLALFTWFLLRQRARRLNMDT
ncbi:MAG: cellulose biosynthesis cyclic di-GMP-binding regulatory protein BcsB [Gammaproteobacteria bacterium]|nr:cellulose biosynthesis cyclic di-GMP-binding regulatory protein BcsB [Gammaproteobacteria bacterium]